MLNKVGDTLHPCLNPLVTLKPFPTFTLELDPSYNAFIASISFLLISVPSRVSHNLFNGIKIVLTAKYYLGGQTKKTEMGEGCGTYVGAEKGGRTQDF